MLGSKCLSSDGASLNGLGYYAVSGVCWPPTLLATDPIKSGASSVSPCVEPSGNYMVHAYSRIEDLSPGLVAGGLGWSQRPVGRRGGEGGVDQHTM